MTRAEFLGKIFDCDPRDILYPIQEPTPICRYGTCARTSCEGCKSDPSYWNAELTDDDEILSDNSYARNFFKFYAEECIKEDKYNE